MTLDAQLRRALKREAPPADLADRVIGALLPSGRGRPAGDHRGGRSRAARWALAAAAAVAIIAGTLHVRMRHDAAAEADRAKRDVLVALQVTSQKLQLVQRKLQHP